LVGNVISASVDNNVLAKATCRTGEGEGVHENGRTHKEYMRKKERKKE
jgi:hypothetical protein